MTKTVWCPIVKFHSFEFQWKTQNGFYLIDFGRNSPIAKELFQE